MSRAVRDEAAFDRAANAQDAEKEGCRAADRSGAARRGHDFCPVARVCGRLGLYRARPAHSPSRRASRESHLAPPISRRRIVSRNRAIRVTFAGEAIRMAKSPGKNTAAKAEDESFGKRQRRSPLTDFLDAAEPLDRGGFTEQPQPELTGTPLTGPVSDWAEQIARDAD